MTMLKALHIKDDVDTICVKKHKEEEDLSVLEIALMHR